MYCRPINVLLLLLLSVQKIMLREYGSLCTDWKSVCQYWESTLKKIKIKRSKHRTVSEVHIPKKKFILFIE